MALKENYKDDILDTSQNVKRKYQMENNGDGTVSFTDVTEYTQQGDSFGSGAINPIAHAINGLNNYNFHPSGSIDLVAYIADDSYYLDNDNKYVLANSETGQALITSEPSTYKALASNTDLYGIEGEDTVSGFEPSMTSVDMGGGVVLSTLDEKINYLLNGSPIKVGVVVQENYANLNSDRLYDISKYSNIKLCVWGKSGSNNKSTAIKIDGQTVKTISDTGGATTLEVGVTENNVLSIGPSSSGGSVLVTYMLLGFYDNNMIETINAPT